MGRCKPIGAILRSTTNVTLMTFMMWLLPVCSICRSVLCIGIFPVVSRFCFELRDLLLPIRHPLVREERPESERRFSLPPARSVCGDSKFLIAARLLGVRYSRCVFATRSAAMASKSPTASTTASLNCRLNDSITPKLVVACSDWKSMRLGRASASCRYAANRSTSLVLQSDCRPHVSNRHCQ